MLRFCRRRIKRECSHALRAGHGSRQSRRAAPSHCFPRPAQAGGLADAIQAVLVAVVAFLRTVDDAVAAVGSQLALRGAAAVRVVQDSVVALLGSVLDAVAAVGSIDAAWSAATVIAIVVERPIIALFGRLYNAVAAATAFAAHVGAIRIVRHGGLTFFAVVHLNHAVAAPGGKGAVGIAGPVSAVVDAIVASLRSMHDAVATFAGLAVWQAAMGGRLAGPAWHRARPPEFKLATAAAAVAVLGVAIVAVFASLDAPVATLGDENAGLSLRILRAQQGCGERARDGRS